MTVLEEQEDTAAHQQQQETEAGNSSSSSTSQQLPEAGESVVGAPAAGSDRRQRLEDVLRLRFGYHLFEGEGEGGGGGGADRSSGVVWCLCSVVAPVAFSALTRPYLVVMCWQTCSSLLPPPPQPQHSPLSHMLKSLPRPLTTKTCHRCRAPPPPPAPLLTPTPQQPAASHLSHPTFTTH